MKLRIFLALMLAGGLAACGNKGEAGGDKGGEKPAEKPAAEMPAEKAAAAPAAAGDPAAEAKQIMNTLRGLSRHRGQGDGAAAANLPVKPRPYQDQEWQNKVTDEHLKKVIVEGGASVGLSPLMAPNPDLKDKPAVVDELVKIVRSYKK